MKKIIALIMTLLLCAFAFAACNTAPVEDAGLTAAGDYLFSLYKDDKVETPNDYDVVGLIKIGDATYNVEWSSNVDSVKIKASEKTGFFTVDVDEKTATEISYTLTATIKAGDLSISKSFDRKVPAYKLMSYAEYAAAADDTNVSVEGIVVGIISKSTGSSANGLYLQDLNGDGGYYVYGIADGKDPITDLKIKVGMTVTATGTKDTYNGLYEVIDGAIEITDSTEKTVTPIDYTELYKNATALNDAALVGKQSMLVTIKGVEITTQELSNGYYKFKLGELETYVRLSSSNNCITLEEKETFAKTHTEKFGYIADVTGIIQLFDGKLYLIPATVDAFTNFSLPTRTDAEKVEMEVGNIKIPDRITEDTEIALPLAGSTYKDDVKFAWAADKDCAVIDKDGKLTITLPEEDTELTITLTVTCGTINETKTYKVAVSSASTDVYVPEKVEAPEADKSYKLFLTQANLGKDLYFAGYMNGNYLATTDKGDKAVDVTVEAVEGGFRLSFMDGETKKYIDIYEYTAGKVGVQITDKPTAVFTFDATLKTYTATVAGNAYYLGTYNNFNTISASKTSYITGENASKIGVSQFPAYVGNIKPATYVPEKVEAPEAAKTYKFFLTQANLGKDLYFAGYMSGNYLATTDKADKAVDVTVEAVEGGFRLSFMDGETKKYIDIYEYTAGKVGVQITDKPTATFTFDATLKTYTATVAGNAYYLGTYNNFNTISASKTSYITGDNASKIGVSQFPAYVGNVTVKEVAPVVKTELAADTGYKYVIAQNNLGQNIYFAGYMSGNYLATTDKISKAVDVFAETVEGGFRFYFMDGETKKYIDIYEYTAGKVGVQITDNPTCTFTLDATLKVFTATVAGKAYYLGTYKTYNTISASDVSYISGENASKIGVSQFPANFATIEIVAK